MGTPDELIEAFTAAVPFALRELAGVEAVARDAGPAAGRAPADLGATIRLATGGGQWRMTFCLPAAAAGELARRILAGATELTPGLVRDCTGEVANVIAGQAKALLVGSPAHFTLSTPEVRSGDPADGTGGWVIRFDSDAGEFAVWLCPPA